MKSRPNWNLKRRLWIAVSLFVIVAQAAALEFSSTTKQTQLVELYTSEGCSSCPPADRWLSELKHDQGLWQEFVPVAFHVDYWDYIGWADRFAKPSHSARQRQHAELGNIKNVYTPGFVVDGSEWRGWFSGSALPAKRLATGKLSAALQGTQLKVGYEPAASHQQIIATIVLLGSDNTSEVNRGENADKILRHDFAALGQRSIEMEYNSQNKRFETTSVITLPADAKAIAIWVAERADLRPIQATGGWLAQNP